MDKLDRIQKLFRLFMTHRHLIDVLQDFTLAPIC